MQKITIFTDGSSLGNPGPGGWGSIVVVGEKKEGHVIELGGHAEHTTNNKMELTAAIEALACVKKMDAASPVASKSDIIIHSDSSYVINGITSWVFGWEKNNWINAAKQQVLNQELWKALISVVRELSKTHTLSWKYVKGHAGIIGNERVDVIATTFAEHEMPELFVGDVEAYETFLNGSVFNLEPVFSQKNKKRKK